MSGVRRYKLWIVMVLILVVITGVWLLFHPPRPQARIITWFGQEWLALEPGTHIVLVPTKRVPTGVDEAQAYTQKVARHLQASGKLPPGHIELVPEYASYWTHAVLQFGKPLWVSENKIVVEVEDGIPGPHTFAYRSTTGEWYKLNVYILGDTDLDAAITHSRPLPRDGTVPIGQGTLGLRIRGASLAERLAILVRDFARGPSKPPPAASLSSVPPPRSEKIVGDVEARYRWSRHGNVLRLHLTLRNQGKKPVKGLSLTRLNLGKQAPQGVSFPYPVPVIEPGQSQVLTFDFPNGDAFGSLAIGWDLFPAR